MPGSRVKEVRMNLPTILESAVRSSARPASSYFPSRRPSTYFLDKSDRRHPNTSLTLVARSALPSLYHSRAGIIASGTATVEAAMMNTPFVMVYRVSPLTYALGKPRVKVPRFAMVNLIAEEEVVPELVQHDFTADKVVARLKEILPDGPPRKRMLQGLAGVKARLMPPQAAHGAARHPADRAAEIILAMPSLGLKLEARS